MTGCEHAAVSAAAAAVVVRGGLSEGRGLGNRLSCCRGGHTVWSQLGSGAVDGAATARSQCPWNDISSCWQRRDGGDGCILQQECGEWRGPMGQMEMEPGGGEGEPITVLELSESV